MVSLTAYLEGIERIKSNERYDEFKNDKYYTFEIFVLDHNIDIHGNLRKPNYIIDNLDDWIIYLEQRSRSTKNKVMRARYNDLLWTYRDKYKRSLLSNGNVKDKCELAIIDYLELAEEYILKRSSNDNLSYYLRYYLYRSWNLAKQIKSTSFPKLIQLMIDIEDSIDEDKKIGLWGFSYKNLINKHSICLCLEQEEQIIDKIIMRVNRMDTKDFYALEYGIKFLLEYYKNKPEEQERYLDILEASAHIPSSNPFENQRYCDCLIQLCHKYNFKERKERAIKNYQYYGKDFKKYIFTIEEEFVITTEKKQQLIENVTSEVPSTHLSNIVNQFILSKEIIKKIMEEREGDFLSRMFFGTSIVNGDGVITKTISTKEDALFHEAKSYWQVLLPYFSIAIENLKDRHQLNAETLTKLLFDNTLYKGQEKTFSIVIQAYFDKDFFSMCYIAVPLIENGLRNFLSKCEHTIYEQNKHEGFENITLTRVLTTLEEYLTEDVIFHLKFILNEKAALNIRNNLTHGLLSDSNINEWMALNLLHVLMLLKSLIGFEKESNISKSV